MLNYSSPDSSKPIRSVCWWILQHHTQPVSHCNLYILSVSKKGQRAVLARLTAGTVYIVACGTAPAKEGVTTHSCAVEILSGVGLSIDHPCSNRCCYQGNSEYVCKYHDHVLPSFSWCVFFPGTLCTTIQD